MKHGGKLYRSSYGVVEKLSKPIRIVGLTKMFSSELNINRLSSMLRDILVAFGVERRVTEKYVLKDVNLVIEPGSIVAVVGASGAGKTTLLRMIIGAIDPSKKKMIRCISLHLAKSRFPEMLD